MRCQGCGHEPDNKPALVARWWRDHMTPNGWRLATIDDYPTIPQMKNHLDADGHIRMKWPSLPPMTLWIKLDETKEGIAVGLAES